MRGQASVASEWLRNNAWTNIDDAVRHSERAPILGFLNGVKRLVGLLRVARKRSERQSTAGNLQTHTQKHRAQGMQARLRIPSGTICLQLHTLW